MKNKRYWSISSKLWLAMTLLILAVLGGLGVAITWLFGDFYLQQKLDSLSNEATEISAQLAVIPDWNVRTSIIRGLKMTSGTQIVLLDKDGDLLAVTGTLTPVQGRGPVWGMGNMGPMGPMSGWSHNQIITDFFKAEYFKQVLSGKSLSIKEASSGDTGLRRRNEAAMLIAAVPLGNPAQGVVLLGSSQLPIQESISAFRHLILFTSLLAVGLATIVSLFFARQVTRPLAIMHKAAGRLDKGDFQPVTGVSSRDEIGDLATALNTMGESLRNHVEWLSEEKSLLESIVAGISDAVIMLSPDGKLLYTNEPAKALWDGNEGKDTKGEDSNRKQEILSFINEVINSGKAEEPQILTLGTQVLQLGNATMSKNESVRGHVAVLRDITASLRAEKERRDFLASVTHELRTPLHLIQGYLEAIEDGIIPEAEKNQHVELVLEEAKRLARLVQELQDMSRLEREDNLRYRQIDLDSLFQDLQQLFQAQVQAKGIKLEFKGGEALTLMADKDRLYQVFINLLENAFRYTPSGKNIRVWAETAGENILFAVQDEGEGIPAEAQTRIFERFYRVDKARTRKVGGMGLGLAIVKQIVEAHRGKVWVESTQGQGSIFWLTIPHNLHGQKREIKVDL